MICRKISKGVIAVVLLSSCAGSILKQGHNPYEDSPPSDIRKYKRVMVPLAKGTTFRISQGAFGSSTHHLKGYEYAWDFDVPFGTPVIAIENGKVIQVYEPPGVGSCDQAKNELAHNVKILLPDGSVAQYVHVQSKVKIGDRVRKGAMIAVTANNGFLCTPQLHFNLFKGEEHLPERNRPETIPVYFEGTKTGILKYGDTEKQSFTER